MGRFRGGAARGLCILLTGDPGHGKDTTADLLVTEHLFHKMAFADAPRRGLFAQNPWIQLDEEGWKNVEAAAQAKAGQDEPWPWSEHLEALAGKPMFPGSYVRLLHLVEVLEWNLAKLFLEVRQAIQLYGTEAGRDIHGPRCWANLLGEGWWEEVSSWATTCTPDDPDKKEPEAWADPKQGLVITDTRFPSEMNRLISTWDDGYTDYAALWVWEIVRPDAPRLPGQTALHRSQAWRPPADFVIMNTGSLEDLKTNVQRCLFATMKLALRTSNGRWAEYMTKAGLADE